jgi:hypothetical protein
VGKLLQQMGEDGKRLGLDTPGMEEICSVRAPTILAFLKSIDDGNGVKGYVVTQEIGLKEEDLAKIREKLTVGKV